MSFYGRVVLPRLIDLVMGNKAATAERAKLVPVASGTVLEIGVGSARNMPHYRSHVRVVYGVDPSIELWDIGRRRLGGQPAQGAACTVGVLIMRGGEDRRQGCAPVLPQSLQRGVSYLVHWVSQPRYERGYGLLGEVGVGHAAIIRRVSAGRARCGGRRRGRIRRTPPGPG